MRVYASSITKEQRTASGAASVAGTDREGFDKVKGLQDLRLLMGKTGKNHIVYSIGHSVHFYRTV